MNAILVIGCLQNILLPKRVKQRHFQRTINIITASISTLQFNTKKNLKQLRTCPSPPPIRVSNPAASTTTNEHENQKIKKKLQTSKAELPVWYAALCVCVLERWRRRRSRRDAQTTGTDPRTGHNYNRMSTTRRATT